MSSSKWDVQEVGQLLSDTEFPHGDQHEISIIKIDLENKTVLGVDREGFLVFGAPQHSDFSGFEFSRAKLEGNKSIYISNGVSIEPVFTLRFLSESPDEIAAIATIFVGLQNQIIDTKSSFSAQEAALGLESYFAGLGKLRLSRQLQVGLFGELAFIYGCNKKAEMISAWHSSPFSTYDFGTTAGRLEVKTSTAPTRLHWLRSSQSVDLDVDKLTYLSIYAPETGDGITISELVERISNDLSQQEVDIFRGKISLYETELADLKFDLESAISSFKFVKSAQVPRINSTERAVIQIAWRCNFGILAGQLQDENWS